LSVRRRDFKELLEIDDTTVLEYVYKTSENKKGPEPKPKAIIVMESRYDA
jgi:hypothetical protein